MSIPYKVVRKASQIGLKESYHAVVVCFSPR